MKSIRAMTVVSAMGFMLTSADAATLVNGSLTGPVGTNLVPLGWTINAITPDTTSSASQAFSFNEDPGDSPDGGTWVGLARNTVLAESFGQAVTDFVIGDFYNLSWYATNTGCCDGGFSADAEIVLDIDGTTAFTGATLAQGASWTLQSYIFQATSTSHTLDFRLATGADAYMGIDGISLSPVPIPAALPLLLSALGFFGFFGWRRKKLLQPDYKQLTLRRS